MSKSQNVTLSAKDWRDIELIKPMLLERKSQLDMSRKLGLRRETVNRKIARWIKTEDFELWLKQAWLEKYSKVDDKTAFEALTKLLGKMVTQKRRVEVEENITEKQEVRFTIDCLDPEERELARSIARRYIKANNQKRPDSIH